MSLVYSALEPGKQQIRLLRILPSQGGGKPICYELIHHSLTSKSPYHALSYEWGTALKSRVVKSNSNPTVSTILQSSIIVNNIPINIGHNLLAALQELRRQSETHPIWVDSLCINQKDNAERNLQLQLMVKIYKGASKTFIWLGPERDDSGLAMQALSNIGTDMLEQFRALGKAHTNAEWETTVSSAEAITDNYLSSPALPIRAIRLLLNRSYWRRVWIIQEYTVSQNGVVVCGSSQMDSALLRLAILFLANLRGSIDLLQVEASFKTELREGFSIIPSTLSKLYQRFKKTEHTNMTLMQLLSSTHAEVSVKPDTTDQKDRIYALLNLADDKANLTNKDLGSSRLVVDYDLRCIEVYILAARAMVLTGHIDLLAYNSDSKTEVMPSWVPDWRGIIRRPCNGHAWESEFAACGNRVWPASTIDDQSDELDRLTLKGCIVDEILETRAAWRPDRDGSAESPRAVIGYFQDVYDLCLLANREYAKFRIPVANQTFSNPGSAEKKHDLLFTGLNAIVHERNAEIELRTSLTNYIIKNPCKTYDDWKKEQGDKVTDIYRKSEETKEAISSYYTMMGYQHRRRPFMTANKYIGLVPERARKGDKIVIFWGAKTPYVLRPREEDGHFELIGEAYVDGIMGGEFVETSEALEKNFVLI